MLNTYRFPWIVVRNLQSQHLDLFTCILISRAYILNQDHWTAYLLLHDLICPICSTTKSGLAYGTYWTNKEPIENDKMHHSDWFEQDEYLEIGNRGPAGQINSSRENRINLTPPVNCYHLAPDKVQSLEVVFLVTL